QSIVVAKPVRHENPARESLVGGCREAALSLGCSLPFPGSCPVCSRVTNQVNSVGLNVLGEISQISAKKNFEIIFEAIPTAGPCLPNLSQVLENVTSE